MKDSLNITNNDVTKDIISRNAAKLLVFHLFSLSSKNMLVSTIPYIASMNSIINGGITIILLLLYLKLFVVDGGHRRVTKKGFIFLLCMFMFLFVSYCLDQNLFVSTVFPYDYVRSEFIKFLTYSLPMFLVVLIIRDYRYLTEYLYKYSYALFICASIGILGSIIFPVSRYANVASYSMSYGNAVLLYTMIAILKYHRYYKFPVLICGILSIFYILINGSRGPLLSVALMIFYLFVLRAKSSKEKLFALLLVICTLVFIIFYQDILQILVEILQYFGLSSRTLIYAMGNAMTYDSGRQKYYDIVYEALAKRPILGLGAFGGEAIVGLTHSLYVDIFANFGYLFGAIYIFIMIIGSLRYAFKYRNTNVEEFIMLLFITCFPRGFFNDSFWTARELWMLMGIFLGRIRIFDYIGEDKNGKN